MLVVFSLTAVRPPDILQNTCKSCQEIDSPSERILIKKQVKVLKPGATRPLRPRSRLESMSMSNGPDLLSCWSPNGTYCVFTRFILSTMKYILTSGLGAQPCMPAPKLTEVGVVNYATRWGTLARAGRGYGFNDSPLFLIHSSFLVMRPVKVYNPMFSYCTYNRCVHWQCALLVQPPYVHYPRLLFVLSLTVSQLYSQANSSSPSHTRGLEYFFLSSV